MDNNAASLIDKFSTFFCNIKFEDLPPQVVQKTKMLILDFVGVSLAGLKMDFPKITVDYLVSLGGVEQATLFGQGVKVPAIHAALGNGVISHALDMDDGYRYGGVHAGVVVIPAALAYAETNNLDGKSLILAVAMGYEIVNRIAKAMNPSHLNRGFHTTGTLGTLGAAAACGVLAGLERKQMTSAIGMSALQGAGLLEILNDGAMVKPLHPGKAAMAGILSVEFAKRGAKGPVSALEGSKGLFKAMADEVKTENLFEGLGENFYIMDQYIKLHAACRHIHPTVDGLLEVMNEKNLSFSDIDSVDVATYPVATSFCGAQTLPDTAEGAKFSIAYSVAMAAYFGDVGEERYVQSVVANSEIQQLASRITSRTDEKWADLYPNARGASISIKSRSGDSYLVEVPLAKGEPENPATHDDFIAKFKQNAATQEEDFTQALLRILLDLDHQPVSSLTELMGLART